MIFSTEAESGNPPRSQGSNLSGETSGAANQPCLGPLYAEDPKMCQLKNVSSVVMIRRVEGFGTRKDLGQLPRVVNEDRKMLGADEEVPCLETEGDEWNLFRAPFAHQAIL